MNKVIIALSALSFFACCTFSPKTDTRTELTHAPLSVQEVVTSCVTPHEFYSFPPQHIPGIPVIIARHGECLGQPNVVVAIWPGEMSKLNTLYVEMMVERYLIHLESVGEHYTAVHQGTAQVEAVNEDQTESSVPAFAAVYKLVHQKSDSQK